MDRWNWHVIFRHHTWSETEIQYKGGDEMKKRSPPPPELKVASSYLLIHATSVSHERLFSDAGTIIS